MYKKYLFCGNFNKKSIWFFLSVFFALYLNFWNQDAISGKERYFCMKFCKKKFKNRSSYIFFIINKF